MSTHQTILVTGGAGYIGSHTVVELVSAGYKPVIVDNFDNSNRALIKNIEQLCGQQVIVEEGDCTDESFLRSVFKKYSFSAVIHFAAYKAVGESVANPMKYYRNNINSTLLVAQIMREFQVKKLIFSSSCTVYGTPENSTKVTENTPKTEPSSPYGWTKYMCEQILTDLSATGDYEVVLLRYFNPIGAHKSGIIGELPVGIPNNIVPYMTQTAAGLRKELTVFGSDYPTHDGTCIRDYIHVVDLAEAHVKALSVSVGNEPMVYNIGTGKGTSVLELIAAFEVATEVKMNWSFGARRAGDVVEIFAEVRKAEKELAWKAKYSVNDAIADAWRWEKYRLENEIN